MLVAVAPLAVTALLLAACRGTPRVGPQDELLTVMSFNLRYGTAKDGENSWSDRRQLVFDVIERHSPDIIGTQEALRFQLDELKTALPEYAEVGVGRDDGQEAGEYTAILYRRDRFEVLDQNTFWFSDNPQVPGSLGWGARLPRICTWARLVERRSDQSFYVYNVHFDHESQESRLKSAAALAAAISGRTSSDPVLVTGDFNAREDNPARQYLRGSAAGTGSGLRDSYRVLYPDAKRVGTFNGFAGKTRGPKIDAVLVSAGWRVEAAAIIRDSSDGRYPSDHFPVLARVAFPRLGER